MQQSDSDPIVRLVADHTGFDLSSNAVRARACVRITEHLSRNGVSCPQVFAERLRSEGRELAGLVDALSVRETYFFRENKTLDRIRHELLPELLKQRTHDQPIQIWSAGCASGEEPYSLAIIMYEAGLSERTRILATDVSQQALKLARQARYRHWSLRDTDVETMQRYFSADGSDQVLNYTIRRMVSLEHHNLASGLAPAALSQGKKADLILLRNVLIYFTPEVIDKVTRTIFDSLAEDGWLITGACDPNLECSNLFEKISDHSVGIYRRAHNAGIQILQPRSPQTSTASKALTIVAPPVTEPVQQSPREPAYAPHHSEHEGHEAPIVAGEDDVSLAEAERALSSGDYARAATIAAGFSNDPHACALRIMALANRQGAQAALRECLRVCADHPLSAELHFLRALMCIDEGQDAAALQSLRRTLYLDNSLAIAHFLLALTLERGGDHQGAQRSLHNAANLCCGLDQHEVLPLSGGRTAGTLAEDIAALLEGLGSDHEGIR